jgi:hypothetical protein
VHSKYRYRNVGYRRITAEVDERHIIGRKFLERCGFTLEAVLEKHKIIQNRNSNTALYVLLNSQWDEEERKLKVYLGIPLKQVQHKIAEIDEPDFPGSIATDITVSKNVKKKHNKKKNNGKKSKA